ncbi:MAG: hypothetical protein FWH23_03295 [Bacteroidales bacterium]|nr:hypothetical protein [Bacteroidales bacterium]MCL2133339.1 hypothetical protein [Bacteroidales bacterium]
MKTDITTILLILAIIFALLAAYFTFFRSQKKPTAVNLPKNDFDPLRLQAYERLIMLMERISPSELVMRYSGQGGSVGDLQLALLGAVRAEIEHNYTQQLYVSNEAWNYVITARNEVGAIINQAAATLQPEEPAIALSKKIIELSATETFSSTTRAIKVLKAEAQAIILQKQG